MCNDISEFMQQDCPECTRLWLRYARASLHHILLEREAQHRIGIPGRLYKAAGNRQKMRLLVQSHRTTHAARSPGGERRTAMNV